MSQILKFENVSYYTLDNKLALNGINLSVIAGEFLAVMGENGAGKTTFCKLINGIIPHSTGGKLLGSVVVDGLNTCSVSVPRLAGIAGMVFDDPDAQLFTSLVRQEAAFGPENLLLPAREIEERVTFALNAVGLAGFEERSVSTLSGGEKQRLSIASALAMLPKILVLDEPLARLDPQGAAEVMSVIKDIRQKYGITVVMATGSTKIAAEFADRICVLKDGNIVACDEAEKIVSDNELLEKNGIQPLLGVGSLGKGVGSRESGVGGVVCNLSLKSHDMFSNLDPYSLLPTPYSPAILVKDFCYSFKNSNIEIKNINLTINDGDFLAIMGSNGCGKTTLLKNITGLLRPQGGDIFIRGRSVKELSVSQISKELGFVMQNPDTQLFTDSVYNEVAFALKNAGFSKKEIEEQADEVLRTVGLEDKNAFPFALSRADRTKTIIACVLAMGCKIIIFDEADVGQDYRGSRQIMDIAKKLNENGFTIVFVTHNEALALEYAHRIVIMDRQGIKERE